MNNEEQRFERLLKEACPEVTPSFTFKERLRARLNREIEDLQKKKSRPLWLRPQYWAPVAAILIAALAGYLTLASPFGPSEEPPLVTTGILEIRVTDAPPERAVSEINVTLSNIQVHKSGSETDGDGGWITVISDPQPFDLIQLKDLGAEEILGEAVIDIGRYNQIRMDVEFVDAVIDGETVETGVDLPSGKLKIMGSFTIEVDTVTVLLIDFDADKSLVFTGQGKVIFKPVVKLSIEQVETE
jgi:hypothetical protein